MSAKVFSIQEYLCNSLSVKACLLKTKKSRTHEADVRRGNRTTLTSFLGQNQLLLFGEMLWFGIQYLQKCALQIGSHVSLTFYSIIFGALMV